MTKLKLYQIDIKIAGTAYIVADSLARAKHLLLEELTNTGHMLIEDELVRGCRFEQLLDEGEQVTLSPIITLCGAWDGVDSLEEKTW